MAGSGATNAFSHDGQKLAYGGRFQEIVVIGLENMQTLRKWPCSNGVTCLAFSPNDSIIAAGHADSTIRLWNTQTGELQAELVGHERVVTRLAFSPDGRTLLSSGDDCTLRAWSVDRGHGYGIVYRRAIPASDISISGGDFSLSQDGRFLAVGYRPPLKDGPDLYLWQLPATALEIPTRRPPTILTSKPH
jgi:WD40 repeat protein